MSITEAELRVAALQVLANAPNGFMATEDLIPTLEGMFKPEGHDAQIIPGRSDTYFSQKVRNLISHRNQGHGLVADGYATYDKKEKGLQIADSGRALLAAAKR